MDQFGEHKAEILGVRFAEQERSNTLSQRGASMVEYALIVTCIALLAILPLSRLGGITSRSFREVSINLAIFGTGANGQ